ncbi:MAG: RNA 2',3'-cyclic phosphodiesterase [Thermodesulfobacteriota bacterium]
MEKIRSFLAIEIPAILHHPMEHLQSKLKETQADVKWVAPQNMHLTIKFFGAISPEKLAQASQIIQPIVAQCRPFSITISGLSCFPSPHRPRVIWLGINKGNREIALLQKEIEEKLLAAGFPAEERAFTPHLTMGRVRSGRNLSEFHHCLVGNQNWEVGTFEAREIVLFKSDLKPTGAIYTRLRTFPFLQIGS